MPADMPAHEVAVDHLIPSERRATMPDRPPARLMSLSTAALLRRTLNAHRHGWVLESRLRRLARMVSEDARRSGLAAEQMGATYVSSTLAGYTDPSAPKADGPDLYLIEQLARRLTVPVIAEGRFDTPALARAAIDAGAHAVVVGTMITNPREITRSFAREIGRMR